MTNGDRLRRNWLKGTDGDAFNALLCCCGHNLRMICESCGLSLPSLPLGWRRCTSHRGRAQLWRAC
jgi:IS5 family transposase